MSRSMHLFCPASTETTIPSSACPRNFTYLQLWTSNVQFQAFNLSPYADISTFNRGNAIDGYVACLCFFFTAQVCFKCFWSLLQWTTWFAHSLPRNLNSKGANCVMCLTYGTLRQSELSPTSPSPSEHCCVTVAFVRFSRPAGHHIHEKVRIYQSAST